MRRLSIRTRLTIVVSLLIIMIAVSLTLSSIYNAMGTLVTHYNAASDGDGTNSFEYRSDDIGGTLQGEKIYNSIQNGDGEQGLSAMTDVMHQFNTKSLIYMIAIILFGSVLTYFILGITLKPMRHLQEDIANIHEDKLNMRIPENEAGAEINHLAKSFNALLDRLEKVFTSQKGFAAAAAHELKTPLSVIKTNLDVLALDATPSLEDYMHMVAVTQSQLQRMTRLVDDLFALSMQQDCSFTDTVDLRYMLSEILQDLSHAIEAKQLRVMVSGDAGAPFLANAAMLRQALANIIENAVKYNKEGGEITIKLAETGTQREVCVTDNGMGIPQAHLPYIFDPFYRVDASRSRKIAGAGLGLAIAKDMIVRHGGSLSAVRRGDGEGMCFTLVWPMDISASTKL